MKVFISWSGETSKAVATALREWLPRVIQNVQPWISNHDIPSGSRWNAQLSERLQDLKTGVLCLTADNLSAPWILFEAGALSKTLDDSLVCPYLFQLEPSSVAWPLAQFQLETASKEGTKKLLTTINNAAAESKLEAGHLEDTFEMWWPRLQEKLSAIQPAAPRAPIRENRELLEEILDEVRSLARQSRVEARRSRILAGARFKPSSFPGELAALKHLEIAEEFAAAEENSETYRNALRDIVAQFGTKAEPTDEKKEK